MRVISLDLSSYLDSHTERVGECLIFTNKPNSQGYGVVSGRGTLAKKYAQTLLHRLVWVHSNEAIDSDKCIMHSCDNRMCANIKHLSLGTWADNNKDRASKGRSADSRGDKHPSNKLTTEKVLLIRELEGEFSSTFLGEFFGVHYSTICYIWRRKLWPHI